MKICMVQQDQWVVPGEYLRWARRRGHEVHHVQCWRHDPLPAEADADMLIVLGGNASPATTKAELEYYDAPAEIALIRKYAAAGKAIVGSCLGAQLVGEAMGAPYGHSPEREFGPIPAHLTAEGKSDPFLRRFPDTFDVGAWHSDMPGVNADTDVLAYSEGCPRQIVRYGKYIYGMQAHMEFDHDLVVKGLADAGGALPFTGRFIQSNEELLSYDYTEMNQLLSAFLDDLTADYEKQL